MKIDPEVRKAEEEKLKGKWDAWAKEHQGQISETAGAGKTKRVTVSGAEDTKNDIMLYAIAEADSHEAAAALFEGHPHLDIPGAWIDVMPVNYLPGMEGA